MPRVRSADSINVTGLNELRRAIKEADKRFGSSGQDALKDVNYKVAEYVIDQAQGTAAGLGDMQRKAAASMDASRSGVSARVLAGGRQAPFFGGAEFGAHRNKRRLLKNTGGRATLVRNSENVDKVIRRVENQTVAYDRYGAPNTVKRRAREAWGATPVKVTGTILGWNQFRDWRGNGRGAGYFLFPTIRQNLQDIIDMYGDEMQKLLGDVFPD